VGASDADMERGQMRVEANVSLRPRGATAFGTRVEVKNMNSFRSVERAIDYEIERQAAALDSGEPLAQETRGWSDDRAATYHMRSKETSDDYRYFPEPDLPPLHVDPAWLDALRSAMPELPAARRVRFQEALALSAYDATVLVGDPDAGALFEATLAADPSISAKSVANWVSGEYLRLRNASSDDAHTPVDPAQLAALVRLVDEGSISRANAKEVFAEHVTSGAAVASIVADQGFHQISDADVVGTAVDDVLAANPNAVADYKAGKTQVIGFLVGQVMKATKGQADASVVQGVVRERLDR
jgi:aspartyl-tRNA(Asn)/glutamyl-tRNA(Gln) amidotransferase subunit B